jgi:hypothetical protein
MMNSPAKHTNFRFWSLRAGALPVLAAVLLGLPACKPDKTAPGNTTGLTAVAGGAQVALYWVNPPDDDLAGVRIQRKLEGYPSSTTDGDTVSEAAGTSFSDTGLTNGKHYFYSVYAFDKAGNFASGAQAVGVPTSSLAQEDVLGGYSVIEEALADPGVPPDGGAELATELARSEELYRAGDACGAAAVLREYEDSAQQYWTAASSLIVQGGLENLYNLGRRLRYDMRVLSEPCPGEERVGILAEVLVDESTNDNSQLGAKFTFGEPKVQTVEGDGEIFTELDIPGADGSSGTPGFPAVPMLRRLIAVPEGAEISTAIILQGGRTAGMNLVPTQFQAADQTQDPAWPPDPATFADPAFVKDPEAYGVDRNWPPNVVTVSPVGQSRDLNLYLVEIASGQYNPARRQLTLFDGVDVKLSFKGGTGVFMSEAMKSPFESRADNYTGAVLNTAALAKSVGKRPAPRLQGEEFMILTHPSFRAAADALAAWKNEKGIVTNVFEVGAGTNYTTNQTILGLIKSEFANAAIRPSYALLLGDSEFIPPWYIAAYEPGLVGSATIGTDYRYASFTGMIPGLCPDIAVGRIPVDTLVDAYVVVNKIINYEKTPPGQGHQAFYSNAAIAAQFQCCRKDTAAVGVDQRTFTRAAEFARDTMNANGKTVQRIYTRTTDTGCPSCSPPVPAYTADPTPRRYSDGTALPADLAPGSGFGWTGNTIDIITAWNAGRFLFIHRDHGGPGGWGHPGFSWADATALTNGALLPVVFSVNCASGIFDNESSGGAMGTHAGAVYFSERLLVNPNGGAVGVLGDTRNSPSAPNSALLRGFIDAIWPSAIPDFGSDKSSRRLGDILNHGKLYLITQDGAPGITPTNASDELSLWNCLGDPTLELWTKYPYAKNLPTGITPRHVNGAIEFDFPIAGAEVTATQPSATGPGLIPVGRVVTREGTNTIQFFKTPNLKAPIDYSITLDEAVTIKLSATIATL